MIRFLDRDGVEQAAAPMSLLKQIDSNARERDAQLLRDQIVRVDQAAKLMAVRADAAIERARADAAQDAAHQLIASQVERLQDQALHLIHRVDSYERRAVQRELDSLPDPERDDSDGDLEAVNEAPEIEDKRQLQTAEDVIAKERDDAGPEEPAGELPAPMLMEVPAPIGVVLKPPDERADSYVCRRDRRAAKRAWLREQRKQR
jgi:hypothetical protein